MEHKEERFDPYPDGTERISQAGRGFVGAVTVSLGLTESACTLGEDVGDRRVTIPIDIPFLCRRGAQGDVYKSYAAQLVYTVPNFKNGDVCDGMCTCKASLWRRYSVALVTFSEEISPVLEHMDFSRNLVRAERRAVIITGTTDCITILKKFAWHADFNIALSGDIVTYKRDFEDRYQMVEDGRETHGFYFWSSAKGWMRYEDYPVGSIPARKWNLLDDQEEFLFIEPFGGRKHVFQRGFGAKFHGHKLLEGAEHAVHDDGESRVVDVVPRFAIHMGNYCYDNESKVTSNWQIVMPMDYADGACVRRPAMLLVDGEFVTVFPITLLWTDDYSFRALLPRCLKHEDYESRATCDGCGYTPWKELLPCGLVYWHSLYSHEKKVTDIWRRVSCVSSKLYNPRVDYFTNLRDMTEEDQQPDPVKMRHALMLHIDEHMPCDVYDPYMGDATEGELDKGCFGNVFEAYELNMLVYDAKMCIRKDIQHFASFACERVTAILRALGKDLDCHDMWDIDPMGLPRGEIVHYYAHLAFLCTGWYGPVGRG